MRTQNKANIVLGAETQIHFLPIDGRSDRCVDLNQVSVRPSLTELPGAEMCCSQTEAINTSVRRLLK